MSRLKDIPELKRDMSNMLEVIQAFRETVQTFRGYRGDPLDKALTFRDATKVGLIRADGTVAAGSGATGPAGPTGPVGPTGPAGAGLTPDYTAPPTATGLTVTAGISYVYFSCDSPAYTQGHGHDRTVVYGAKVTTLAPTPTFSDAVELCAFQGPFGAYPTEPLTKWAIWIKWRSNDGVLSVSPAGGTNGTQAQAGLDVTAMIASFGTAWIDDAKIANLSAAKLTAGDGTIGGNLKSSNFVSGTSGWLLQPSGSAEFRAGNIGGNTIDATGMQSPGYIAGNTGWRFDTSGMLKAASGSGANVLNLGATGAASVIKVGSAIDLRADGTAYFRGEINIGAYIGYGWPAAGNYGAHLGPSGLLMGNAYNNKYLQVTNTGDIYTPSWNIVGGVMTLNQANVINTLNIAGQAVTVPVGGISSSAVALAVAPVGTVYDILTFYMDTLSSPVHAVATGSVTSTSTGQITTIDLLINGSIVDTQTFTGSVTTYRFALSGYMGGPPGGAFPVQVRRRATSTVAQSQVNAGVVLFALGSKR